MGIQNKGTLLNTQYVLGIDLGGTNVKCGLVSLDGRMIARTRLATAGFISDKNQLIQALCGECLNLLHKNHLKQKDVLGVGIGLPGLVDIRKGVVKFLPNLPGWENVALKNIMEKKIKMPVFIDNDVKLITLGEWKFGAGIGIRDLICLTLGTGVGSGLILNNALYRGAGFTAGELGHIPLNEEGPLCNCGGRGCLERTVGNKYLLEKARKLFGKRDITLEEVTRLADRGNSAALKFWKETASHIGIGLVSVVNLLNPKRIIIGGGIANAHRHLFPVIFQTIRKRAMSVPSQMVQLRRAKLGDHAGIMGAQVLVDQAIHGR